MVTYRILRYPVLVDVPTWERTYTSCLRASWDIGIWFPSEHRGSSLKSYTILESLHFWLCSAVTSSNCPSMQWTHVSSSCHGFPNAKVKGQLSAPADRFPLDQATSDTRSRVDTGGAECVCWIVFTAFSTVSARCWFYCCLPELKWFFSSLLVCQLTPSRLFSSQKTIHSLS